MEIKRGLPAECDRVLMHNKKRVRVYLRTLLGLNRYSSLDMMRKKTTVCLTLQNVSVSSYIISC